MIKTKDELLSERRKHQESKANESKLSGSSNRSRFQSYRGEFLGSIQEDEYED